ncbi:MAG: type II toxin-antitoxin system HicA family toxin [Candidatus Caenarcaniphilales bacterium]|jgi:predicted RNA binding protein YcfA (HicA-like mRNA interferase family)|nr:type II toxin-antitoxin system HicA family toxin [Candidatus Caenarcaniphilales bacterium]
MVEKYRKLLSQVKENPKNVTVTELIKLMELIGFSFRRGSKNHYIFYYQSKTICVAPPHPGKHIKPVYVKECLKAIEEIINHGKKE